MCEMLSFCANYGHEKSPNKFLRKRKKKKNKLLLISEMLTESNQIPFGQERKQKNVETPRQRYEEDSLVRLLTW